jgi:hypothetical protein
VLPGSVWARGFYGSNDVKSNGANCVNGSYRLASFDSSSLPDFQCTELVMRWADNFAGISPLAWGENAPNRGAVVNAQDMWGVQVPGTQDVANGTGAPQPGDILVIGEPGGPGHVGIVLGVWGNQLYFVGENQTYAQSTIAISNNYVTPSAAAHWMGVSGSKVLGWIHLHRLPRPNGSPSPALGGINIWNYCVHLGYTGEKVTSPNAYGYVCTRADGTTAGINMDRACEWQYGRGDGLSRFSNFYSTTSWQCFGSWRLLGNLNFTSFCRLRGASSYAVVSGNAYGVRCRTSFGSTFGINTDQACQLQNYNGPSLARVLNFFSPTAWQCFITRP